MKTLELTILQNACVAKDIYLLRLSGAKDIACEPGQFASLSIPNFFLRRPLGIVDDKDDVLSFLYKVVGEGTLALSRQKEGEKLNVLLPLGHGFEERKTDSLLVGAGLGIAPLLFLAKRMKKEGKSFHIRFAFNTKEDIPLLEDILSLDPLAKIATLDGSYGTKGLFTDILEEEDTRKTAYCCGPVPFLKACEKTFEKGYVSLECRMGCGYGICNGCTLLTPDGKRRKICKDGPVFAFKEVCY